MAVFNKDKPDYPDDQRLKNDFDSLRGYSGNDQYQLQNGYGMGGYGAGQNSLLAQQRQQQLAAQQLSMARGQNDYSILGKLPNAGYGQQSPNPSIFQQQQQQQQLQGSRGLGQGNLTFDNSSFPSLGSSQHGQQGGQGSRGLGGYNSAAMYGNTPGVHGRDDDFTIEKEDFPALPGSQKQSESGPASSLHGLAGRDLGLVGGGASGGAAGSIGSSQQQQQQHQQASQLSTDYTGGAFDRANGGLNFSGLLGSPTAQGMTGVGAAAAMSAEARFGLGGLLDIIRMTDKDMNALALGTDLTGFGLNLNSAESLFPTFASPFTDQALTPDPQFRTPACYMMHPPSLKAEHLSKFQLETLFYMFYSMPKDILQACAAQELYRREWRYHAELKLWLKPRAPHELMQSHPSVMFVFFDVAGWETRLFTASRGPGVVQALLSEEEVRVKLTPPPVSS